MIYNGLCDCLVDANKVINNRKLKKKDRIKINKLLFLYF